MPHISEINSHELMERIADDLADGYDEELELEIEDRAFDEHGLQAPVDRLARQQYFRELFRLQGELVKLQDWVQHSRQKVVVIFEGRDAAGKGGVIKRITQRLNPRVVRVAALPAPNDRERTQWYFQRYVAHLPAAGEIVLFDRSWYNRAGVEKVMGFCTEEEYEEFFRSVPEFEKMLVRSGIRLIKYWFSISDEEQHLRFLGRIHDPLKQWKLSPMDLESRVRWEEYTKAKEAMLERTHIPEAPWWVVQAVDKKKARLNCIAHLLGQLIRDLGRHATDLQQREHQRGELVPERHSGEAHGDVAADPLDREGRPALVVLRGHGDLVRERSDLGEQLAGLSRGGAVVQARGKFDRLGDAFEVGLESGGQGGVEHGGGSWVNGETDESVGWQSGRRQGRGESRWDRRN